MPTSTPRPIIPLAFALGLFAVTLWAPQVFNDGDTWWHVAAGRLMIARHAVLTTDPFSFTHAGQPWMVHEWLSEVLFAGAFNLAGWGGVQLITAIAAGATAGLLARHTGRWTAGLPQVCLLLGGLALSAPHLLARPHVLAWPLLEMWTAELVIARSEDRAPHWRVLPLMTIWANLHGSFLFGLALTAPFALEALIAAPAARRLAVTVRWGVFGLAAGAAALLTPHGLEGVIYALRLTAMTSLNGIGEWAPADFHHLSVFGIVLLGAGLFMLLRPMKLPPLRALILVGLTYLALQHNRHEQLLGLVGALLLAAPLGEITAPPPARFKLKPAVLLSLAAILALGLSVARLAAPTVWRDSPSRPVRALASVPASLRASPVLNDFQFGGYLIGQDVAPYVDSRADMYGDAFLNAYSRLLDGDAAQLATTLRQWDIRWAILRPGTPLAWALAAQPGWRQIHADPTAVVYSRDAPSPPSGP